MFQHVSTYRKNHKQYVYYDLVLFVY